MVTAIEQADAELRMAMLMGFDPSHQDSWDMPLIHRMIGIERTLGRECLIYEILKLLGRA